MSKFTFTEDSYCFLKLEHAIEDNMFQIRIQENLRMAVPKDVTQIVIPDYLDISFDKCSISDYIKDNEYFCVIQIPLNNLHINNIKVTEIETYCSELNGVTEPYLKFISDNNVNIFVEDSDINRLSVNNESIIRDTIYRSPENSIEIEISGLEYDCNNLPLNYESFDVIHIASNHDFSVINIPSGWKLEELEKRLGLTLEYKLNDKHNRLFMYMGTYLAPNRCFKKLVRI